MVSHWPIESVQDVRRFVEPAGGFTFFYGLHFRLDGGTTSLADLENDLIRAQGDARIHAAINCASRSCPSLQARPFEAATLNEQLEEVTRAFCNDTRHVRLDSEARTVQLSRIFDWFGSDFEQHAQRLDRPPDVLAFVEAFAEPELELQLGRARQEGWEREFVDYDWSLNRSR